MSPNWVSDFKEQYTREINNTKALDSSDILSLDQRLDAAVAPYSYSYTINEVDEEKYKKTHERKDLTLIHSL
jgi:hypothetical protein